MQQGPASARERHVENAILCHAPACSCGGFRISAMAQPSHRGRSCRLLLSWPTCCIRDLKRAVWSPVIALASMCPGTVPHRTRVPATICSTRPSDRSMSVAIAAAALLLLLLLLLLLMLLMLLTCWRRSCWRRGWWRRQWRQRRFWER